MCRDQRHTHVSFVMPDILCLLFSMPEDEKHTVSLQGHYLTTPDPTHRKFMSLLTIVMVTKKNQLYERHFQIQFVNLVILWLWLTYMVSRINRMTSCREGHITTPPLPSQLVWTFFYISWMLLGDFQLKRSNILNTIHSKMEFNLLKMRISFDVCCS